MHATHTHHACLACLHLALPAFFFALVLGWMVVGLMVCFPSPSCPCPTHTHACCPLPCLAPHLCLPTYPLPPPPPPPLPLHTHTTTYLPHSPFPFAPTHLYTHTPLPLFLYLPFTTTYMPACAFQVPLHCMLPHLPLLLLVPALGATTCPIPLFECLLLYLLCAYILTCLAHTTVAFLPFPPACTSHPTPYLPYLPCWPCGGGRKGLVGRWWWWAGQGGGLGGWMVDFWVVLVPAL